MTKLIQLSKKEIQKDLSILKKHGVKGITMKFIEGFLLLEGKNEHFKYTAKHATHSNLQGVYIDVLTSTCISVLKTIKKDNNLLQLEINDDNSLLMNDLKVGRLTETETETEQNKKSDKHIYAPDLITGLDRVLFCASKDKKDFILHGVYFMFKESLTLISSDSYRLAYATIDYTGDLETCEKTNLNRILNLEGVKVLYEVSKKSKSTIEVIENEKSLTFNFLGLTPRSIEIKRVDRPFPDYASVIPQSFQTSIIANTAEFLEVVQQLGSISDGKNSIHFIFDKENKKHTASISSGIGTKEETISISNIEGENIMIAFSPSFLIDSLKHIDTTSFVFQMSGKNSAAIIKPFNPTGITDKDYYTLVMPKRWI